MSCSTRRKRRPRPAALSASTTLALRRLSSHTMPPGSLPAKRSMSTVAITSSTSVRGDRDHASAKRVRSVVRENGHEAICPTYQVLLEEVRDRSMDAPRFRSALFCTAELRAHETWRGAAIARVRYL